MRKCPGSVLPGMAGFRSLRGKVGSPNAPAMTSALTRLLTIFAFVLMPFGMIAAPAAAQAVPVDHSAMSKGAGHCDEQPGDEKVPAAKMNCTATCTALPLSDAWVPLTIVKPAAPRTLAIAEPFSGIDPEIATPPPRTS